MQFRREPVAGSGRSRWHSRKNRPGKANGVSASSRIVSHRYADEGEKGPSLRREIRRKERRFWTREMNTDA